jgi:nitrile hydratase accessory protein
MTQPAFAAPWEARAFAMVRSLRDGGVVSAEEWTAALGAQTGDDSTEYRHWLAALEQVLTEKRLVSEDALLRYRTAWAHAAARTPHGNSIELSPNDFHD